MPADAWEPQRGAIRTALAGAGLTQVQVATQLNTTQKHISCVLNGKTAGSLELWARLADLVGMSWQLAPETSSLTINIHATMPPDDERVTALLEQTRNLVRDLATICDDAGWDLAVTLSLTNEGMRPG